MISKSKKFTEINPATGRTWSRDELWTEIVRLRAEVVDLVNQGNRLADDLDALSLETRDFTWADYKRDLSNKFQTVIYEVKELLRGPIRFSRRLYKMFIELN